MKKVIKTLLHSNSPKMNRKYEIIDDNGRLLFGIHSPGHCINSDLLNYTQQEDNKMIEIINYDKEWIYTKYYENYYPLVLLRSCTFYSDDIIDMLVSRYMNKFRMLADFERFYKDIVNEYVRFIKATGFYSRDIAANNILVNNDCSDLRIIDAASFTKNDNNDIIFSPIDIFCTRVPKNIPKKMKLPIDEIKKKLLPISILKLSDF